MRAVALLLLLSAAATAAEPVEDWKPIADPPKDRIEWTVAPKLRAVTPPHFFDGGVAFADGGGPFAAAGRNGEQRGNRAAEHRVVVDLRTGKTVSAILEQIDTLGHTPPTALSHDGKFFAAAVGGGFGQKAAKVGLFDTTAATAKLLAEMPITGETDALQFGGNRLLVATKTGVDVFDVATRKSIFNVEHKRSGWGAAKTVLTPGGKYVIDATENGLRVYDVESTKLLFKMAAPEQEKGKGGNADGLAVSPDGTKVAVMTEAWNNRRLVVYDAATGKPLADSPVAIKNVFNGNRLGWSVDGKGILLNGEAIADPDTGKVVFEFPNNTHPVKLALTLGQGVVWEKANNERVLVVVGLDAKQTAAAKAAVASGGTAADAMLPPLTKPALDVAAAATAPPVGVKWAAQPDPAPPTAAGARPVRLDFPVTNLRAFFTTPGDKAVALIELNPNGAEPQKTRVAKRVDLASGKTTTLDLPPTLQIEDVTADGATVLTVDYVNYRRVDLFPLDGGKAYGFKPYESLPADAQKIVVNRFVGRDRIVTVNEKGLAVVWALPDFKQVAAVELPGAKAWALSPNKRYLAAIHAGAVRVIDLTTGGFAGDLLPTFVAQETPMASFIAFRGDGREVLAGFQNAAGPVLTRWDTTTGRVRHEAPYAGALTDTVKQGYLGDNYLMTNFTHVYDLDRQAVVWTLTGGTFAWFRGDDRVWAIAGGFLTATKFPTDDVDRTIAEVADGPGGVLKPGTRVGLTLDVQGGMAQNFRSKISEGLKAGFRARELELVTKGADVEVAVTVTERDTGEKISFRGFGRPGGESVNVLELTAEVTVSVNGEVVWAPDGAKYRTHGGFVTLAKDEDLSEHLYKQMWNGVVAWSQGGAVPRFLAKTSAGVQALPQVSLVTPNGLQTTGGVVPRRRK